MRKIVLFSLFLLCALVLRAQETGRAATLAVQETGRAATLAVQETGRADGRVDTTATDTTLQGAKMKELIVTKDKRLPIFASPSTSQQQPHVKTLSEIIGRKATDYIMHPFAFKQRKEEKRRRKAIKKLEEFSRIKTNNELLREALIREGIDPDSLLRNK